MAKFGKGVNTPMLAVEHGAELEGWRKFIKRFEVALIGAGMEGLGRKTKVKEVKFLGHIVSEEGIRVDPEKEQAIKSMPPPVDRKGLRRFLAMVNYLSRFSPMLSEAQLPLRELDRDRAAWLWTAHQQDSFEKVKNIISSAPVLTLFDIQKKHRVTSDASQHTLGAALLQEEKGEWQPVAYASRKMTEAEQRYGQIEKEALAITWACEKFDFYLVGSEFEIETDHKPLIPLLGVKDLSDLPLRIQRFRMRLMRYSYSIFHTAGDKMYLADLLSRPATARDILKVRRVERHAVAVVLAEDDALIQEVRQEMSQDELYKAVAKGVRGEWPSTTTGELSKLKAMRNSLNLVEGLVLMNARLYIPRAMRTALLRRLHIGHQGIVKTNRRARDSVWWPSLGKEVAEMIDSCSECIKEGRMSHQPLVNTRLPGGPWEEIGTDLFEFEGRHYVIFVDYYSRWIEALELKGQTGQELVRKTRPVLARLGYPKLCRSDNGPCYISKEWRDLMQECQVRHVTSSPHYPESNGLAERAVPTVKRMWRKEKDKTAALLAYRTTALESGNRPDELMFGRRLRTTLPIQHTVRTDTEGFRAKDGHLKERQKINHDKGKRAKILPGLDDGDSVWIKTSHEDRGKRGVVKYRAEDPDSYWVETDKRLVRRNRCHLRKLPEQEMHQADTASANDKVVEVSKHGVSQGDTHRSRHGRLLRDNRDPAYDYD